MVAFVTADKRQQTAQRGDAFPRIAVVGEGQLAEAFIALGRSANGLSVARSEAAALDPADADLVVAALDYPDIDQLLEINRRCFVAGVALLPAWLEFGEARLGPTALPDQAGCLACAERRRLHNHPQSAYFREALRRASLRQTRNSWALPSVIEVIGALLADEASRVLHCVPEMYQRFTVLHLATLEIERHAFIPDAMCRVCGSAPDDRPASAPYSLDASASSRPGTWRGADVASRLEELKQRYVDRRAGLVTALGVDITTSLCAVGTSLFRVTGREADEWGAGLTQSFEQSQAVSIVEALERYGGLQPRGKRTIVIDTYEALRRDALDPRSLILYSPSQYARPQFACVPFDDTLRCAWVWGYSFGQQRPILVPEQCAYYGLPQPRDEPRFIVESSNGCAVGASLAEAIFHGLLEQIERDAVLCTWFGRQTPRRWELSSLRDTRVLHVIDRLVDTTGYALHVLDVRQEIDVHAIWLIAVNPRAGEHRLLCTSRAHVELDAAVAGALGELCGTLLYHRQQYERRREQLLAMAANSELLVDRLDHSLLAGIPEIADRFAFLLQGGVMSETVDRQEGPRDLAAAARDLIARVLRRDFDVIVIDQTTPEQAPLGLRTVKVMVPGFVPMSYSQRYRRVDEAPRLRGCGPLNPHPHPFA